MPTSPRARAEVTCHVSLMRMMPINTAGMIQVGYAEKEQTRDTGLLVANGRSPLVRQTHAEMLTHIITFDDKPSSLRLFISPSRVMRQYSHLLESSDLLADSHRDCLPLKVANALSKPFPRHCSGPRHRATVVSSHDKHAPNLRNDAGLPAAYACSMILKERHTGCRLP